MLAFEGHPGDVLWIDDRFMNGYAQRDGGVPIVGINEVLTTLRSWDAVARTVLCGREPIARSKYPLYSHR
jgi:hypothetical protein